MTTPLRKKGETGAFTGATGGSFVFSNHLLIRENGVIRLQSSWNEYCSYSENSGITRTGTTTYFISSAETATGNSYVIGDYSAYTAQQGYYVFGNGLGPNTGRTGSNYNGTTGWCYARVVVNPISYGNRDIINCSAYIFFPDGENITGPTLVKNSMTGSTSLTTAQIDALVKQGVLFLPCLGKCESRIGSLSPSWSGVQQYGYYQEGDRSGYGYSFTNGSVTIMSGPGSNTTLYTPILMTRKL